jgi:hypothetical protein
MEQGLQQIKTAATDVVQYTLVCAASMLQVHAVELWQGCAVSTRVEE